jgi:hypothetical protein
VLRSQYASDGTSRDPEGQSRTGGPFQDRHNSCHARIQAKIDDWENWQAFKGAYEETMQVLRRSIVTTLKRDEKKMYGFGSDNPRMQKIRAEQREERFAKKGIQKDC